MKEKCKNNWEDHPFALWDSVLQAWEDLGLVINCTDYIGSVGATMQAVIQAEGLSTKYYYFLFYFNLFYFVIPVREII